MMNNKSGIIAALVAVTIGLGYTFWSSQQRSDVKPTVEVTLPTNFSKTAQTGQTLFEGNCAACHGKNAAGTKQGPPLVHIIYEPNHHGDQAFYRAAQYGVRQHHWPFGNMPPVTGVTQGDVSKVITYIRELQRANGIS